MTNLPSWAMVEAGICRDCGGIDFLFTTSVACQLPNDIYYKPYIACVNCHMRMFRSYSSYMSDELVVLVDYLKNNKPEVTVANYPVIATYLRCYDCGGPETSDELLVPAHKQNDSTIIVQVHPRCRTHVRCCGRDIIIGRSYRDYGIEGATRHDGLESAHTVNFEGNDKCDTCLEAILDDRGDSLDDYFVCEYCNSFRHTDIRTYVGHGAYCERCVDAFRYNCDDCGRAYWDGDDHDCDPDYNSDSPIHDYSYKPMPFFFPPKSNTNERLYFGVELEVESRRGTRSDCAEYVQQALGSRAYLKYDGSLDNGFEIVTHPHTLDELRKEFAFDAFASFREKGLRSWNTTTCGLHVHVSRDAFGIAYDNRTDDFVHYEQVTRSRMSHELRFIKLIYDNQVQVCKLAGRTSGYAHFHDKGNLAAKVRSDGFDRHVAVNTENNDTLEVRVFKGSLKPERVIGAVEFVHAGVEYTRNLKVSGKNRALSWLAFCGYVHTNQEQYPNLYSLMLRTFNQERDMELSNSDD